MINIINGKQVYKAVNGVKFQIKPREFQSILRVSLPHNKSVINCQNVDV